MADFLAELRKNFSSPKEVVQILGLDESVLKSATESHQMSKPTRLANIALQLTSRAVRPLLALDAKGKPVDINLMPVFEKVSSKNFKPKELLIALDSALKGKLATDADPDMGHVAQMLDHIGGIAGEKGADESVSEEQHKAMEAAAHGKSTLGIPKSVGEEFAEKDKGKTFDAAGAVENLKGYLKEKGMDEEMIKGACDALGITESSGTMTPGAKDADETEEEKKKREEEERKAKEAKDAKGKDAEVEHEPTVDTKDMVTKGAMDAALRATAQATAKSVRETERGIRVALSDVKPWVGELPTTLAFDSAVDVHRHAATMLKIPNAKTMHADALLPVIQAQPKPGAKPPVVPAAERRLAMDAAGAEDFAKKYPGAAAIRVLG